MKNKFVIASLLLLAAISAILAFVLKDVLLRELLKGLALFFVLLVFKQLSAATQLKERSLE